ncbi:hypothetical protein ACSMXN_18465 [Jatrophihabitans sp. DSM 45814]
MTPDTSADEDFLDEALVEDFLYAQELSSQLARAEARLLRRPARTTVEVWDEHLEDFVEIQDVHSAAATTRKLAALAALEAAQDCAARAVLADVRRAATTAQQTHQQGLAATLPETALDRRTVATELTEARLVVAGPRGPSNAPALITIAGESG